jgi:hypothetical protein
MSRRPSKDEKLAEALANAYGDGVEASNAPPPDDGDGRPVAEAPHWEPDLNPTQRLIFDDPARHVLAYGEKGTGKTWAFEHKIVRHAYENNNALVLIVAPMMRTGNEGVWTELDVRVLPQWLDGMGLEYTPSKMDPFTKDRHRWIRNMFGGWSKLLLMSIPHATQVQSRVKGPTPSMVYVEELTNCDGREYWSYLSGQLGRRHGITGPQQFCASCNPEGPSHWVYKVFWEECLDDKKQRSPEFSVYHVPIEENRHRLPPGYIERLHETFRSDPVELRRLIYGEWIDRPTGEGLFKDYYIEDIHLKGNLIKGQGLRPLRGFPIIIGYDLGQVFSSVTLLQLVETKDKPIWLVFDEVDHLGERILYKTLAWEVIQRMRHWQKLVDYDFQYMHVTDETAINMWRPGGEGSYDAWEFEREYNKVAKELKNRKMKLLGCPKGAGSVPARVRLLQSKLYQEEIFVSAMCKNAREMLINLEADNDDPEKPKRSRYLHKFDSLTYPIFKREANGLVRRSVGVAPELIRCGSE